VTSFSPSPARETLASAVKKAIELSPLHGAIVAAARALLDDYEAACKAAGIGSTAASANLREALHNLDREMVRREGI